MQSTVIPATVIYHSSFEPQTEINAIKPPRKRTRKSPSCSDQSVFTIPTSTTSDNVNVEQQRTPSNNRSEHFSLICEPNPLQRKSYRNERRYLLPNPVTVQYLGDPGVVIVGTVEVSLVNDNGVPLGKEMQDTLEGVKLKPFDDQNHAAFSLLMRTTSGESGLRLKFVIRYKHKVSPHDKPNTLPNQDDDVIVEELMSSSFRVESNRKKNIADHPCLKSLSPSEGPRNISQEVSLHGTNFGDGKNIRVRFGGQPVAAVGVDKDTITITSPRHPELQPNSRVPVQIGYSHPTRGVIWRPEALFYTYLGDKDKEAEASQTMIKQPSSIVSPVVTDDLSYSGQISETPRCLSRCNSVPALNNSGYFSSGSLSLIDLAATAVGILERQESDGNESLSTTNTTTTTTTTDDKQAISSALSSLQPQQPSSTTSLPEEVQTSSS